MRLCYHFDVPKETHSYLFNCIGMLAWTFRIRFSNFKRLPNPTMDYWPHQFKVLDLVGYFRHKIDDLRSTPIQSPSAARRFECVHGLALVLNILLDEADVTRDKSITLALREKVHAPSLNSLRVFMRLEELLSENSLGCI